MKKDILDRGMYRMRKEEKISFWNATQEQNLFVHFLEKYR